MKAILNQLYDHQKLTKEQARQALLDISQNDYPEAQVAAFICTYLMRGVSVEELEGFRSALLEKCISVDLHGMESIDVCGTGGDGKNTFNISTTTAFVLAGAGYKVTKHGNYGVSSVCGSSNVLEYLGYQFTNDQDVLMRQLDQANICFFHAPLFHPALKSVGPVRKALGVKTFFNLLGPLVNPCQPTHQLVGVFNLKVFRLYQFLLEKSDANYTVVHATDGYDEVSLTGPVKIVQRGNELLKQPEYFGTKALDPTAIFGGDDVPAAAKIFMDILGGKGTEAQRKVVMANTGLAIQTFKPQISMEDAMAEAAVSMDSGLAQKAFTTMINA